MNTMTNPEEAKQIPYGMTDYKLVRRGNYYYLDKTPYIKEIEHFGRYLFFIRPRRFGKSFFLSLLESYYDVYYKDQLEELFSGTWIYAHPTPERSQYLVLSFNFSQMELVKEKLETSFINYTKRIALSFLRKYADLLLKDVDFTKKNIEESLSPADILSTVIGFCKDSHRDLYVIVDEYDNFANTLLTTSGSSAYLEITRGKGFLRSFFNVLKGGTTGTDAPIKRLFITGVSPITMDDVTSGFNIGEQISLLPQFNQMLGFTRQDVEDMLDYYTAAGLLPPNHNDLLELIDFWYGNYLFSEDDHVTMYNTDMVLYFMTNYLPGHKIPRDLIDHNVRIDYGKLRHLIVVDNDKTYPTTNGNFSKLKQILETGEILSNIVKGFPIDEVTDTTNFNSLLFYFGLLTINGTMLDQLRLVIPNETVKRLYYDYILKANRETGAFSMNMGAYSELMRGMAFRGEWEPLLTYIINLMGETMALRDFITGEKSLQAFLNVYLGLSDLYLVHGEKELNMGYADLFMEPFVARYPEVTYAYLIEIKYVPADKKVSRKKLNQLKKEAETQLNQYSLDKKFQKVLAKSTLTRLMVIFSGHQPLYLGKAE
ncbi:MAG: hypothetical protein QG657_4435 [Acidobacteriota bacterium]|nr:hypothetical protein [Acidobacteriota bacterium]